MKDRQKKKHREQMLVILKILSNIHRLKDHLHQEHIKYGTCCD